MKVSFFKLVVSLEQRGGGEQTPKKSTQIRVDLFQNFRFKFDIAWFILWSLEVLNPLQTYVLTIGTHNPCNRGYLLYVSLCLSTTQAIVLKLGLNNPHHKKVSSGYIILFADDHHFSSDH